MNRVGERAYVSGSVVEEVESRSVLLGRALWQLEIGNGQGRHGFGS